MNWWSTINIILNLFTLISSSITILICLFILFLVVIFHRQSRSVPLLLACHTSLTLLLFSLLLASMVISSTIGFLPNTFDITRQSKWCYYRGFLIHGILCMTYDSYILQAIYRFLRVVFHRHKYLHRFSLYCPFVLITSLLSLISISPVLFRGDVVYLPLEYYCQTPFTNLHAIMYLAIRLYLLPILIITIVYIGIVKHVRQTNVFARNSHRRTKQNRRDLIIIKRLLLILTMLILLGLPSISFLFIYMFTGYLIPITYRVGWLTVSLSMIFLAYMLIQLTRPLRNTMRKVFT